MAAVLLCLDVPLDLINKSCILDKVCHSHRTILGNLAKDREYWGKQLIRMNI